MRSVRATSCFAVFRRRTTKIARAASARQRSAAGQQAALQAVREVAAEMHVSVIPHSVVLQRSYDAVHLIERQVEDAQHRGDLKAWTNEYKEAKATDPTLTYARFKHAKALALVAAAALRMRNI
jgi:hypothetical protein